MNALNLTLPDGRTEFSPGDRIALQAQWQLVESPPAIEVRLVWYTRGKGDTDVCIVDETRFDNPQSFAQRQCEFRLPEAPYSFSGKLVSLIWAVELVAQPSGESKRLDIVVAPEGREIHL
jgi:hypothetical protein